MHRLSVIAVSGLAFAARAGADNIYVMTTGTPAQDSQVMSILQTRGHTVTLGVEFSSFDGTQSLAGFQAVYFQASYNYNGADMPVAGQDELVAFVNGGGELVTSEWVLWDIGAQGKLQTLAPLLPVVPTNSYSSSGSARYAVATPDSVLDSGLPASFTFSIPNVAGCETVFAARPGGTVYFTSDLSWPAGAGLIGWRQGAGRVLCLSTIFAGTQLDDANVQRLLGNVFGLGGGCYANCDGSTTPPVLNVQDFSCFLNKFAAGDLYANCDGSTTPPVLNVQDFACFLNAFAAGCS